MKRDACVQVRITVRRVARHPITRKTIRSGALLRKHVVRSATLGLVPDALNDCAFHHAQLNMNEVVHVLQDTITINMMTALIAASLVALRTGSE